MKKKILSIIMAAILVFSSVYFGFAEEITYAYDASLNRLNSAYSYLNETYLDSNLGMYIEYVSQTDLEMLKALADSITKGCTTDKEKCTAIYTWMDSNVKASMGSYSAIDVFRTLSGVCSGHAQLMSALFKLSGIKSAICRGYYINTKTTDINNVYKTAEGHQWVMAYYDNDWYLYDDLWGQCGNINKENIAEKYFIINVDGILPYGDGFNIVKDTRTPQTVFMNGNYVGYYNGKLTTLGSANFSYGGCLSYCKVYYTKSYKSYFTSLDNTNTNVITGHAFTGGYYLLSKKTLFYVKENGILLGSKVVNYNDNLVYINGQSSVYIDESIDNNGLTDGKLNLYIGETIDLSNLYDDTVTCISSNTNIISIDGLKLTALAKGSVNISIGTGTTKSTISVNVYGDVIKSNELFQELCDHDCSHCVLGKDYCDYCGKELVNEPIVEPISDTPEQPQELVSEPQTQEPSTIEENAPDQTPQPGATDDNEPIIETTKEGNLTVVVLCFNQEDLDKLDETTLAKLILKALNR